MIIKRLAVVFAALLIGCAAKAQVGQQFPAINGSTVKEENITIPEDTKGKYTLVGLAFSKKSDDELESWFEPVYSRFVYKPEKKGLFSDFSYDVNVYFVPMFSGVNKAAAGTAKKQALKKLDPRLHAHVLFYVGQINEYRDQLKLDQRDIPYFFVLDKNGKIVYATEGAYSEKKMEEVEEILSE